MLACESARRDSLNTPDHGAYERVHPFMLMLYRIAARRVFRRKPGRAGPFERSEPKKEVLPMQDSFGSLHPRHSPESESESVAVSERMTQAEMVVQDHMLIALA